MDARGDRLAYVTNPYDLIAPNSPREAGKAAGGLTVWDLDGKELFNLDEEGIAFLNPAFSPDGTRVAAVRRRRGAEGGGEGRERYEARVWDIATGRASSTIPDCTIMTFDPDGKRLAGFAYSSERSARARLWDAATGEERARLEMPTGVSGVRRASLSVRTAGRSRPRSAAGTRPSPSGSSVSSWYGTRRRARSWELGDAYTGVTFSPDGARIAAFLRNNQSPGPGKPEVGVWDAVTGRQVLVLKGPASYVYAVPTVTRDRFLPGREPDPLGGRTESEGHWRRRRVGGQGLGRDTVDGKALTS